MVLPHNCLTKTYDKDSPKSPQKKVAITLSTKSPQGSTSPPMWSELAPWGSSPLFNQVCLKIVELILLSLLCNISFLGCAPLFSYMDSKGHHHESSRPLSVLRPLTNHQSQMNHRTTLWTRCAQTNPCAHQLSRPLGPTHPNIGCTPHADVPQPLGAPNLVLRLMFGKSPWCIHTPKAPTFPTSTTLGCDNNPKFCLLENLDKSVHTLLARTLHFPQNCFTYIFIVIFNILKILKNIFILKKIYLIFILLKTTL